jgi:hypothetical protein
VRISTVGKAPARSAKCPVPSFTQHALVVGERGDDRVEIAVAVEIHALHLVVVGARDCRSRAPAVSSAKWPAPSLIVSCSSEPAAPLSSQTSRSPSPSTSHSSGP